MADKRKDFLTKHKGHNIDEGDPTSLYCMSCEESCQVPRLETPGRHIKRSFEILQNIAAELNKLERERISDLVVIFWANNRRVLTTDLPTALDYLANDIYWNEDGNWADAEIASVCIT